jgi:hypothetical protein
MKRTILIKPLLITATMSLFLGCVYRTVYVQQPPPPQGQVVVSDPQPPPPQIEVIPAAPDPTFIWVGGGWEWRGGWVWVGGHWGHRPYPGAVWVHGHWGYRGHNRVWIGARWH